MLLYDAGNIRHHLAFTRDAVLLQTLAAECLSLPRCIKLSLLRNIEGLDPLLKARKCLGKTSELATVMSTGGGTEVLSHSLYCIPEINITL